MSYWVCDIVYADFNPRLPRGRRLFLPDPNRINIRFQPTPPSREATEMPAKHLEDFLFQPTPPSREATSAPHPLSHRVSISTHASLAGGDEGTVEEIVQWIAEFQPTPPSREATDQAHQNPIHHHGFQPTPPSREATTTGSTSS